MIATLPALTHMGGSPLRGGREGWMLMALQNPPVLANKVPEDEINDPGSWGSYPVDPVVRVAMLMMQPCSGGQTPGLVTPSSTQTWSGSSSG